MKRLYECQECKGLGVLNDYAFSTDVEVCPNCDGSGQILCTPMEARFLYGEVEPPRRKVRKSKTGAKS